jgi:predicted HicB family RNase H-like nuclease
MSELTYKGFTGSVVASVEDGCLIGEVLFINDHIVYEGQTIAEIQTAFEASVDQYLDYCARNNKQPSKPYSGSFNIRTGAELHRLAAREAYKSGISLNEYVVQSIKNNMTGNFARVS